MGMIDTPKPAVLSDRAWNELHDFITLSLDALGDRPSDFDEHFLRNAVTHLRLSIRIADGALERITTGSTRKMDHLCGTHESRGRA